MGQIIGSAAKPKRCNLSQLSQLVTPAAGEHILVSSDNSMNAAGQGNFDCYIVGDGKKAATTLELKKINEEAETVRNLKNDIYGYSNTIAVECTQGVALSQTNNITLYAGNNYTFSCNSLAILSANLILNIAYVDDSLDQLQIYRNGNPVAFTPSKNVKRLNFYAAANRVTASGTLQFNITGPSAYYNKTEINALIQPIKDGLSEVSATANAIEEDINGDVFDEKIQVTSGTAVSESFDFNMHKDVEYTISMKTDTMDNITLNLYNGTTFIWQIIPSATGALKFYTPTTEITRVEVTKTASGVKASGDVYLSITSSPRIASTKARVVLPAKLYAVVGEEFNIYWDCMGLTSDTGAPFSCPYLFDVVCTIGSCDRKSYRLTPTAAQLNAGNPKEYPFELFILDNMGNILEHHVSAIVVVPRAIVGTRNYMPIGDSNTAGLAFVPKYMQALFDSIDNGKITEVGMMGYLSRALAGNNQYYAHTAISGATIKTFVELLSDSKLYSFYKCAITGFDTSKERKGDDVLNPSQNVRYTIMMMEIDANGSGYVWLRGTLNGASPATGNWGYASSSATTIFSITSVAEPTGDGILKANSVFNWSAIATRYGISGTIDIISIDLGINDCGQGGKTVFRTSMEFDEFVANVKLVVDSFLTYNASGKVVLALTKSPSASRNSKCQDGYRVNLHRLREAVLETFDNGAYNENIIISQCGLAIDREYGYSLASDYNNYNKVAISSYFDINAQGGERFTDDYDIEGYHPQERGYKQVAYSLASAILYADYLMG